MFTAAAAPVSVPTEEALITPAVRPLSVFSAAAPKVASSSVTASSPRLEISPATPALYAVVASAVEPVRVVTVPAFTTPSVRPLRVFSAATARVTSVSVTASLPRPVIAPARPALNAVVASAVEPVRVVTVPAFTTPVVRPSRVFSVAAASVMSFSVTDSSPRPVMPPDVRAVIAAVAAPVRVPTELASIAPVVRPSRVFRLAAPTDVSSIVTASLPRLVMPVDCSEVVTAAVEPVISVTVAALIAPPVKPSRVFRAAAEIVASVRFTASLPRFEICVDCSAVVVAAAEPLMPVTEAALIVPEVSPSRLFRSAASTTVSVSTTASSFRPVIPAAP